MNQAHLDEARRVGWLEAATLIAKREGLDMAAAMALGRELKRAIEEEARESFARNVKRGHFRRNDTASRR